MVQALELLDKKIIIGHTLIIDMMSTMYIEERGLSDIRAGYISMFHNGQEEVIFKLGVMTSEEDKSNLLKTFKKERVVTNYTPEEYEFSGVLWLKNGDYLTLDRNSKSFRWSFHLNTVPIIPDFLFVDDRVLFEDDNLTVEYMNGEYTYIVHEDLGLDEYVTFEFKSKDKHKRFKLDLNDLDYDMVMNESNDIRDDYYDVTFVYDDSIVTFATLSMDGIRLGNRGYVCDFIESVRRIFKDRIYEWEDGDGETVTLGSEAIHKFKLK